MRGVHRFFTRPSLVLLTVLGGAGAWAADGAGQPAQAPVQASWQPYDLRFQYMGISTYYSCGGLEDRLKHILRDLGARSDVSVSAMGCAGNDVSRMLQARIRVNMPSTTAAGPEQVTATPKEVTLKTHLFNQNGSGDCELLEQVRDRLLPELKLKPTQNNLTCIPGHAMIGEQRLVVAALVPEIGR